MLSVMGRTRREIFGSICKALLGRHGWKRAWVTHWQTSMYKARQREILGQVWVDNRRTISNRARQRVNPGNTGRNQNMGEQARQDYNNLGCSVE